MFGDMNDSPPVKILETVDQVLDALGGSTAAAALAGRNAKVAHASNWRAAGRMPPRTLLIFRARLAELGLTAPAALWGVDEPANSETLGEAI